MIYTHRPNTPKMQSILFSTFMSLAIPVAKDDVEMRPIVEYYMHTMNRHSEDMGMDIIKDTTTLMQFASICRAPLAVIAFLDLPQRDAEKLIDDFPLYYQKIRDSIQTIVDLPENRGVNMLKSMIERAPIDLPARSLFTVLVNRAMSAPIPLDSPNSMLLGGSTMASYILLAMLPEILKDEQENPSA